jgi:NAD(P)H-nitrite reductase large subunit
MYIYMGHMKYEHTKPYEDWFWEKNKLKLVKDHVVAIDIKEKKIQFQSGTSLIYDKLVIATGSVSNRPPFPGMELKGVQSLYGIPDLQLMNENTKAIRKAVIAGGGLIGIEMAEMLLSRNISVTFLIRENRYWNNILPDEEADLITRHIREHGVDLRTVTELKEIKNDDNGKVGSIVTSKEEEIECEFVGITVGVSPNISIVKNTGIETDKGVFVTEFFETNIPDVYAIGDCVQHRNPPAGRKAIEQVWYTGRIHGETLAQAICGKRTAYNPGPWFNSAKFFDIEYQTYGMVNAKPAENESSFYWEHEEGKICFRVVFNKTDETIIGFNVFGMRLRHALCDQWLQEKRNVDYVMANLHLLNFDAEFFEKHEAAILKNYNLQTGKKITVKRKKSFSLFR